jgi:hypothetical protein
MVDRTLRLGMLVAWSLTGGCTCRPDIPVEQTETPDETGAADTAPTRTGDTAPPPPVGPCALFEVEPNGTVAEAFALPTDRYLCGAFDAAADFDYYAVELASDGWLGVYVDAQIRGSLADVTLAVTSDVGVGVERGDDEATRDAHLLFPAPAGRYTVLLLDANFQGDTASFFYELVATVAKKPVDETGVEHEPNGTSDLAQTVRDGDLLLGASDDANDVDWYAIDVPAGPHRVVLDLDGYALGSPGNFTVWTYPDGLIGNPRVTANGLGGAGFDPYAEVDSSGNERLYVRVEEALGKGGLGWWYALSVRVEAL